MFSGRIIGELWEREKKTKIYSTTTRQRQVHIHTRAQVEVPRPWAKAFCIIYRNSFGTTRWCKSPAQTERERERIVRSTRLPAKTYNSAGSEAIKQDYTPAPTKWLSGVASIRYPPRKTIHSQLRAITSLSCATDSAPTHHLTARFYFQRAQNFSRLMAKVSREGAFVFLVYQELIAFTACHQLCIILLTLL